MNKTLIAITLTLAAQTTLAQGFAPWDERDVARDNASAAVAVAPAGFAPWRDRATIVDVVGDTAVRVSDAFGSVFRPWS